MDDSAPRFGRTLLGTRSVFDEIVIRQRWHHCWHAFNVNHFSRV